MDSRLQMKINSLDPTRDISAEQEESRDHGMLLTLLTFFPLKINKIISSLHLDIGFIVFYGFAVHSMDNILFIFEHSSTIL